MKRKGFVLLLLLVLLLGSCKAEPGETTDPPAGEDRGNASASRFVVTRVTSQQEGSDTVSAATVSEDGALQWSGEAPLYYLTMGEEPDLIITLHNEDPERSLALGRGEKLYPQVGETWGDSLMGDVFPDVEDGTEPASTYAYSGLRNVTLDLPVGFYRYEKVVSPFTVGMPNAYNASEEGRERWILGIEFEITRPCLLWEKAQAELAYQLDAALLGEDNWVAKSAPLLERELKAVQSGELSMEELNPVNYLAGAYVDEDQTLVIQTRTDVTPEVEALFRSRTNEPDALRFERRFGVEERDREVAEFADALFSERQELFETMALELVNVRPCQSSYAVEVVLQRMGGPHDAEMIRMYVQNHPELAQMIPLYCVQAEPEILE